MGRPPRPPPEAGLGEAVVARGRPGLGDPGGGRHAGHLLGPAVGALALAEAAATRPRRLAGRQLARQAVGAGARAATLPTGAARATGMPVGHAEAPAPVAGEAAEACPAPGAGARRRLVRRPGQRGTGGAASHAPPGRDAAGRLAAARPPRGAPPGRRGVRPRRALVRAARQEALPRETDGPPGPSSRGGMPRPAWPGLEAHASHGRRVVCLPDRPAVRVAAGRDGPRVVGRHPFRHAHRHEGARHADGRALPARVREEADVRRAAVAACQRKARDTAGSAQPAPGVGKPPARPMGLAGPGTRPATAAALRHGCGPAPGRHEAPVAGDVVPDGGRAAPVAPSLMRPGHTDGLAAPPRSGPPVASASPAGTAAPALVPHLPCGAASGPFFSGVLASGRAGPVLPRKAARFALGGPRVPPASSAISARALSMISRGPLRSSRPMVPLSPAYGHCQRGRKPWART